jgi:hypothetical protein
MLVAMSTEFFDIAVRTKDAELLATYAGRILLHMSDAVKCDRLFGALNCVLRTADAGTVLRCIEALNVRQVFSECASDDIPRSLATFLAPIIASSESLTGIADLLLRDLRKAGANVSPVRACLIAEIAGAVLYLGPPALAHANDARWQRSIIKFFRRWYESRPPELEDFSLLLLLLRKLLPILDTDEIAVLHGLFAKFSRSPRHTPVYLAILEEIAERR